MRFTSILAVAAVAGAAVAGYSIYKKYKKEHEDLENDFNEFEDDRDYIDGCGANATLSCADYDDPNKKYTSLSANKGEFVDAAKNTLEAAKGMIPPVKNIAKDVADIIQEKACDANVVAGDYYSVAKEKVTSVAQEAKTAAKDKLGIVEENALGGQTQDDIIMNIDVAGNIREED